jgi:hypothetical protein
MAVMQKYLKKGMPVLFNTGTGQLAAIICDVLDPATGAVSLHVIDTSGFARPEINVLFGEGPRTWELQVWV